MKNKKHSLKYIIVFILSSIFIFTILTMKKDERIDHYLNQATKQYTQEYNVLYEHYNELANVIFETRINTPEVQNIFKHASTATEDEKEKIREKLYFYLRYTYEHLKNFDIKQLHFHLKNNDSFLRFHKPEKYGDNLSDIRETVTYVNKNHKPINGFEEGRLYNGYRFVYPMFYKYRYIGSVEVSFSTLAITKKFINSFDANTNFFISKDVSDKKMSKNVKNVYQSTQYKGYYIENKAIKTIKSLKRLNFLNPISKNTIKQVKQRAKKDEHFSLYDSTRDKIITFITVKNPITKKSVGLLEISSSAQSINDKKFEYYFMLIILNLFLAFLLYFLYNEKEDKIRIEKIVKREIKKNKIKDKQLQEQSRLAQMGEMISMIAHQWRQPLSAINSSIIGVESKLAIGRYDLDDKNDRDKFLKFLDKKHKNIIEYVQGLSETIDEFRNFFKPDKQKQRVSLIEPIQKALKIVKVSMSSKGISIKGDFTNRDKLELYNNEVMQVILNILKNAEDNFIEKNIQNPAIRIETLSSDKEHIIKISDNGGGIPEDILPNIFDPYFSTKDEKNGTGLGLYMSKIMIEDHHEGELKVTNTDKGVCFEIRFRK